MSDPLSKIREVAPEIINLYMQAEKFVSTDGALPAKIKKLIAMAIDANKGSVGGVTALALDAMKHGATRDEVIEALRVAYYMGGSGALYTSAYAMQNVLK